MYLQILLPYLSPVLGFVGTVLIYFFGVPRQIDTKGANYIICEGEDEEEKKKIKLYKFWGNLGLILIGISFILNLPVFISIPNNVTDKHLESLASSNPLEIQGKCAKQAYEQYKISGWEKNNFAGFTNHYNEKLNKCFLMIESTNYPTTTKTLIDAFEGKVYGSYMWKADAVKKYLEVKPFLCKVTIANGEEKICNSSEEFDSLTNYYIM